MHDEATIDEFAGIVCWEPTVGGAWVGAVSVATQQHVAANLNLTINDSEVDIREDVAIEDHCATSFGHAVTRSAIVGKILG
ncbi:unannotated protein [freshwater metagenome]|uniref:Unannotated protein n=1 Tax=freshwater metagenome TaxID=449393 RepID=A0A6J6J2R2_9ZZZZ